MQTEKLEFVPLIGLVLWLFEKENAETESSIVRNNVADTLTNVFLKRYYAFYKVTITLHNKDDRRISSLPNAFSIIVKFIQSTALKPKLISLYYRDALMELDTILAIPTKNSEMLQSVTITPNQKIYDEFQEILRTFNLEYMNNDQLIFFLFSLFRRWGNPKIYKKYILARKEFNGITFKKSEYSDFDYFVALDENINARSFKESDLILEENKKLKTELLKSEERIKELELIQTSQNESKLGNTRAENNAAKLILALSAQANIDTSKPYAQYESLKTQAELLGIDKFPSNENVATWLKRANSQNPN